MPFNLSTMGFDTTYLVTCSFAFRYPYGPSLYIYIHFELNLSKKKT